MKKEQTQRIENPQPEQEPVALTRFRKKTMATAPKESDEPSHPHRLHVPAYATQRYEEMTKNDDTIETMHPDQVRALASDLFVSSGAAAACEIFRLYLLLSEREKDRVYNFVIDAETRDQDEAKRQEYEAVDTFLSFFAMLVIGKTVDKVCALMDMTPFEYDRLIHAWEAMRDVEQAVRERINASYGKEVSP